MAQVKQKKNVKLIICIAVLVFTVTICAALLITNIFIPVKYLSAYLVKSEKWEGGGMRVRFLDVGYGDCTLVEFPNGETLLIDGGDGSYSNEKKILKALNKSGIDKIDYLVCTSVKGEHSGGLAEIVKYKEVDKVFAPYCKARDISAGFSAFCSALENKGIEAGYCEYGNGVFGDGYGFCFLSPDNHKNENPFSDYNLINNDPSAENINNASAIIYLYCGDTGVLLLGDCTSSKVAAVYGQYMAESCFVLGEREITLDNCSIIRVGGHGLSESASSEFYDLIKPDYTIVSTSKNLLPSLQSISDAERYSQLFKTYEDGTVTAIIDGGVEIKKEKE